MNQKNKLIVGYKTLQTGLDPDKIISSHTMEQLEKWKKDEKRK